MSYKVAITASLLFLLGLPPEAVRADEILSVPQADALCSTAAFEPAVDEDASLPRDPLVQSRLRHTYTMARLSRLIDVYSVTLDTHQYGFLPAEPGLLAVDTLEPFPLFGGVYNLDLGPTPDISFLVSEEQLEAIQAGYASDQLLLRLDFNLVSFENPSEPYCITDGDQVSIQGRLLAATLLSRSDSVPVAQAQTERLRSVRVRFGIEIGRRYIPPQPHVQITATAFPEVEPPEEESEFLRVEAETRLMPCYLRGLNVNGRLQGAVVVTYRVADDGQVIDPAITIDAVDQPVLTGCVIGTLGEMSLPREVPRPTYPVRMTVIFRLD